MQELPILPLAPQALVDLCDAPRERDTLADVPLPGIDPVRAEKRAREFLMTTPPSVVGEGSNNHAYKTLARAKDFGVTEDVAFTLALDFWNPRCTPPWTPEELRELTRKVYLYGKERPGIKSPEAQFGVMELPTEESNRIPFEYFIDIHSDFSEPQLVDNLLDRKALSLIYGPSNCGKTFFALDLSLHIAWGRDWFGRKVDQGGVIYVAAEGGGAIRRRIMAFRKHYDLSKAELPFTLISYPINLLDPKVDIESFTKVVATAQQKFSCPTKVVIVDTMARTIAGGNENASEDVGAYIRNLDYLRQRLETHLMLIHHSGKVLEKGARGHSSLRAAVDTEIQIEDFVARITKQRDLEMGGPIGFSLDAIEIGVRHDGKVIKSCVVRPKDLGAIREFARKPLDLESNTQKAYLVLEELLLAEGKPAPPNVGLSIEKMVISVALWRLEFINRFYGTGKSKQAKSKAFNRAFNSLKDASRVTARGEYAWI